MISAEPSDLQSLQKSGRLVLSLCLTVGLFLYAFQTVEISDLTARYTNLSWPFVGAGIAAIIANIFMGTVRFHKMIGFFSALNVPFTRTLKANIAGLASSLFLINIVGSILGRYALLRKMNVSVAAITAIVTAERALLVVIGGSLFVLGWSALLGFDALFQAMREMALLEAALALTLCLAAVFTVFRWKHEIRVLTVALSWDVIGKTLGLAVLTLLALAAMMATFVFCALAIGIEDVNLVRLAAIAAIVVFVSGLPISINGWGVREVTSIFVFGEIGVPATDALALSVLVGIISTFTVICLLPFALSKPKQQEPVQDQPSLSRPTAPSDRSSGGYFHARQFDSNFLLVLGVSASLFIFVTLHIPIGDSLIAINFADPIAIIALSLAVLTAVIQRRLPFRVPRLFLAWLGMLSAVLVFGFVNGWARFGITDWALSNRLMGWGVLLGYTTLGAMVVTHWGRHGLRRLCETILTTAAIIVLFDLIHREAALHIASLDTIASNFEGFSTNRNAFAFQLLIVLGIGLAYSRLFARSSTTWGYEVLLGLVMIGVWRTYSNTGMVTGIALIAVLSALRLVDLRIAIKAVTLAVLGIALIAYGIPVARDFLADDQPAATLAVSNLFREGQQFERWLTLEGGWEMWLSNPVFGSGLGAFYRLGVGEHGGNIVIHSTPLWILAEFGLVGIIFAVIIPTLVLGKFLLELPARVSIPTVIGISVCFVFAVFGLLHDIAFQRLYWFTLGAIAAAYFYQTPSKTR